MNEASKTRTIRPSDFYSKYMNSSVLDIGCGPDLVVPHAIAFDQEQGDANEILKYFEPESFHCVHSSHCLEHMKSPQKSIEDWWKLVEPDGFLITVVPDEDLYEQGYWPSLFNSDHKSTFSLTNKSSQSPVSFNIKNLISSLPNAVIVSVEHHSNHYCAWKPLIPFRPPLLIGKVFFRLRSWLQKNNRIDTAPDQVLVRICRLLNIPVDQTLGKASAQIQVIAQKKC